MSWVLDELEIIQLIWPILIKTYIKLLSAAVKITINREVKVIWDQPLFIA